MTSANDAAFLVFLSVERLKFPARGRAGGLPGAPGRIRIDGRKDDIPGKCELRVNPGERLIFETPGGGGFGPPTHRDPKAVTRDIAEGLVSAEGAKLYGADR